MLRDKDKYSSSEILESVVHITRDSERDVLVRSLVGTLQELLDAEKAALYWVRAGVDGNEACLAISVSRDRGVMTGNGVAPVLLAEDADFSHCVEARLYFSRAARTDGNMRHIYPVFSRDSVVGVLEVIGHPHDASDIRLTSGFLQVFRNYIQILDESERDTLTGLLNRRTFDKNIGKLLSESRKAGDDASLSPSRREEGRAEGRWLAVMDVDHFKRINDKYGHLYGDEVLLLLAGIMRRSFRDRDNLFRFGGEEFVVALEPTDDEGARTVLDRFRQVVENFDFPQVGKVTISIGYVRIASQDAPATVVGHADEALYYAKHHGRNQVCSYEALVKDHKIATQSMNVEVELF